MKPDLVEELRDYYEQLENIKEDALELTAPLEDTQFNWRPSPKRWYISECLCHLNLANGLDVPMLTEEIERGRAAGWTAKGQGCSRIHLNPRSTAGSDLEVKRLGSGAHQSADLTPQGEVQFRPTL